MGSLSLDASVGQATFHNTPAGPCSRLKARRSEHAPSLCCSCQPGLTFSPARGWFRGPLTHMARHSCTLRRAPFLVLWSPVAVLTKAQPFHQPLGPSCHVAGPACGTHSGISPCWKTFTSLLASAAPDVHMASPIYITCQASAGVCPGCLWFTAFVLWIHLCSTKECPKWGCPSAKELWETLVSEAKGHIQLDFDVQILFIVSETNDKNVKEKWNKK